MPWRPSAQDKAVAENVEKIYRDIISKELTDEPERSNYPTEGLLVKGEYVFPLGSSYRAKPRMIRVPGGEVLQDGAVLPSFYDDSSTRPVQDNPTRPPSNQEPSCSFRTTEIQEEEATDDILHFSSSSSSSEPPLNLSDSSLEIVNDSRPESNLNSNTNTEGNSGNVEEEVFEIEPPLDFDDSDSGDEQQLEQPRGNGNSASMNQISNNNGDSGQILQESGNNVPSSSASDFQRNLGMGSDDVFQRSSVLEFTNETNEGVREFGRPSFGTMGDSRQNRNRNNDFLSILRSGEPIHVGLGSFNRGRGGNRGIRKQRAPRKELDKTKLDNLNKVLKEWGDHLDKAANDPEFEKNYEANDEICKVLDKNRKIGFFEDQDDPVFDDPTYEEVEKYQVKLSEHKTIKFYDAKENGYIIVNHVRSDAENLKIRESNMDIMRFLYDRKPIEEMDRAERKVFENVKNLLRNNDGTMYKIGDVSVVIDLHTYNEDTFPPTFLPRKSINAGSPEGLLLRPVIIDGVAIQYVSKGFSAKYAPPGFKPFITGKNTEKKLYTPELNLNIQPIFEVILNFLIRGHKTKVFYPKYYEKYVTSGGNSKVDDIFAFKTLLDCDLIEFCEVEDTGRYSNWFATLKKKAELVKGIFVSTGRYSLVKDVNCRFEKVSDRILTPTFWNTPDCVMVIEPTIRYLDANFRWKTIPAEEILYYHEKDGNESIRIEQQLYLNKQIEQICHMCQLYPLNVMTKTCIKEILLLIVESRSNVEMPYMSELDYRQMC